MVDHREMIHACESGALLADAALLDRLVGAETKKRRSAPADGSRRRPQGPHRNLSVMEELHRVDERLSHTSQQRDADKNPCKYKLDGRGAGFIVLH